MCRHARTQFSAPVAHSGRQRIAHTRKYTPLALLPASRAGAGRGLGAAVAGGLVFSAEGSPVGA
jgi:hypothetical protein